MRVLLYMLGMLWLSTVVGCKFAEFVDIENSFAAATVELYEGGNGKSFHLLEQGMNVDYQDPNGYSLLLIASLVGDTDLAQFLVDSGAKLELKNDEGMTPLYAASYEGHKNILLILLKAGADPNVMIEGFRMMGVDQNRELEGPLIFTPLIEAVENNNIKIVEILLKHGADPNVKMGETLFNSPLLIAVLNNDIGVVEVLLESGADVDFINSEGMSALKLAEEEELDDILAILKKYLNDKN